MFSQAFFRRFLGWSVCSICSLGLMLSATAEAQTPPAAGAPVAAQAPAVPAGIPDDKTDALLKEFQKGGMREIIAVPKDGITLHLYITAAAETMIRQKTFEIPDDNFKLDYFSDFVLGQFRDAISYFKTIVPNPGVTEIHLIIDDLKEAGQGTISQALTNSRIIQLGLSRWHKIFRGRETYLAEITTIHEFTHVVNYAVDPDEDKFNREMTGIVFELVSFTYHEGMDGLRDTYPKVAGRVTNTAQVKDTNYISNGVLRNLAFWMFWNVLNGNYIVNDKVEPSDALRKFARLYLLSKEHGAAGFDAACAGAGIADTVGQPLKLVTVQDDLYANLTGAQGG